MKLPPGSIKYDQISIFNRVIRGHPIAYYSKPGLPYWESIAPPAYLIAENVSIPECSTICYICQGNGAVAVALAEDNPSSQFFLMDHNSIASQLTMEALRLNAISNAEVNRDISFMKDLTNGVDIVILDLPKGRQLTQYYLNQAHLLLRPHGEIYISGSNNLGVQSAIRDAKSLFGKSTILGLKKGCRLARLVKDVEQNSNPEWTNKPGIKPGTWYQFSTPTPVGLLHLSSLPGVFSYNKIDEGTQLLLSSFEMKQDEIVLDLGCGIGVLGIVASLTNAARVDFVDNNLFAIMSTKENLRKHGISNYEVITSDILSAIPDRRYDLIISNPPFHTGKDIDYLLAYEFINQSRRALLSGGKLTIVANRFIRYERLMFDLFGNSQVVNQNSKYHIITARKN